MKSIFGGTTNGICGVLVLAALAVLLTGCPGEPEGDIIAKVNDDYLTKQELEALVPEGYSVDRENLPKILDKWVSNALMYQEAVKRGLLEDEETQLYLKRLERDYLVNELLDKITSSASVTQSDMLAYYEEHKDEFSYEVKIVRIVLQDSVLAERTLEEIRGGADFKKLAKERSQDMLLEGGQESRYFARGVGDPRMGGDPQVEETIFALDEGEVSDVLSTQEGYQILKVVDRKKVKAEVSFAEVKEYIEVLLSYRRSQDMVDELLTSLRAEATVELTPDTYFE